MKKNYRIAFIAYTAIIFFLTVIPFRFRSPEIHHFPWPIGPSQFEYFDLWANIFFFIPFGFSLHFLLSSTSHYHSVWKALLIGCGVSFTIETLQIIIPARYPSFSDLFANTLGSGLGAFIGIFFETRNIPLYLLAHRKKIVLAVALLYTVFLFSLPFISQEPISNWHNNANVLIGNNVEGTRPWKGDIVSAAIYDRQLSDSQIQQHFQNGPSVRSHQETPLLRYQFNEQGKRGTAFTSAPFLSSKEDGAKAYERIHATRQFSVEAWFYPARRLDHGGRIISFASPWRDLFYLRQGRDEMTFAIEGNEFKKVRLDWEGVEEIFLEKNWPIYMVGVYHEGGLSLYFNGKKVKAGQVGNGFFLLSSRLNFDRMDVGGRGLLVLIFFGSLGFLLAMIFPDRPARIHALQAVFMLSFVLLILIIEGQQTPSFFTPRTLWVPPVALLLGFMVGAHPRVRPSY